MKKLVAILIVMALFSSMFVVLRPFVAASTEVVEPTAIDTCAPGVHNVNSALGSISLRTHHSAWNLGDVATWLVLDDYDGFYFPDDFTLRAIGPHTEIWVQNDPSFQRFNPGDPRPTPIILDSELAFLLNEFESKILPTDTGAFGNPVARDGSAAALPGMLGLPTDYYAEGNTKNVLLVENVIDESYFDPTYPNYIAGFFEPGFDFYFDRNIITLDTWHWEYRLGPAGTVWIPPIQVNRPYVYDSTLAHEYQHLIHNDYNPYDDLFLNEGCSMFAEVLNGFGLDPYYINSYMYTPDNSLTVWGDQGGINILADYGAAALFMLYINDHFGGTPTITKFVDNGVPGIPGLDAVLAKYHMNFDKVFHDWKLANLIRQKCGPYSYSSINLNDPSVIPMRLYPISGLPVPQQKGTDFGYTYSYNVPNPPINTYQTMVGPYGSDYINFSDWNRPGFIYFDGDDYALSGWRYSTPQTAWWSGGTYGALNSVGENMLNTLLVGKATVTAADPTLTIVTRYNIEPNWDFGFVQVSTDNGQTWTSLSNSYTTSSYKTDLPAIQNNMPGLTGMSPSYPSYDTMTFDLTPYAGQTVTIGFRYMTDEATTYSGWRIRSAVVSGTDITSTLTTTYPKATFQVTAVNAIVVDGKTIYIPLDMYLTKDTNKGMTVAFPKSPSYTILIVSPTMLQGVADYSFQATTKPIFNFFSN